MNQHERSFRLALLFTVIVFVLIGGFLQAQMLQEDRTGQNTETAVKLNKLTPAETQVIVYKGTEAPFTGLYYDSTDEGVYLCKQCDLPLFRSADKFHSGTGWPSFDDAIPGAVRQIPDADGIRTEIVCARCGAHLGHVFLGEGFTDKNVRNCVNSISLNFVPAAEFNATLETETAAQPGEATAEGATAKAYFAGGCFWGTEYYLQKQPGVIGTTVGYMGGTTKNPTYSQVSHENTGHAETVEVEYDPAVTDYEALARLFFDIHDPTQLNRQGPDVGYQYRSAIFYTDDNQKEVAEKLINILKDKGYKVVTRLVKADTFWPAELYHQDYYAENGHTPYCHFFTDRFGD